MLKCLNNFLIVCSLVFVSCGGSKDDPVEDVKKPTIKAPLPATNDAPVDTEVADFFLGGSISGLTGTIIIKSNGKQLSVVSDGDFQFANKFSNNTQYNVVIQSNPFLQNCLVSSGSGTISSNVNNVIITCTTLTVENPSDFSEAISASGSDASKVQVAMNSSGNAIVVWQQSNGAEEAIFMSEYDGSSWNHPISLSNHISVAGFDAADPSVALDDAGNAIIAWMQSDGFYEKIYISEKRGGAWIHPTDLSVDNISIDNYYSAQPRVAMDQMGNAVIVYMQDPSTGFQLFISEYRNGTWSHSTDINLDNISVLGQAVEAPEISMTGAGTIIVWQQSDGTNSQVYKSEYRGSSWSHPSSLADDHISPDGFDSSLPSVTVNGSGHALITWSILNGSNTAVMMSEYRGAWIHPVDESDIISPLSTSMEIYSSVDMNDSGDTMIIWSAIDGVEESVYKSEYISGSWTHPSSPSDKISIGVNDFSSTDIAINNTGAAIAIWDQQNDSSDHSAFIAQYASTSWQYPSDQTDHISPAVGSFADHVQVTMNDEGNAIIAWQENDGTNTRILIGHIK